MGHDLRHILVIEDEPLIQKSLKILLEKRGCSVSVESSGSSAIKNILQNDYDRIICDLMLQDISGFDVIEEAKLKYSSSEIAQKFVIMTAYCSEQVLEKAKDYNCAVLSKPFENINKAISLFLNEEQ